MVELLLSFPCRILDPTAYFLLANVNIQQPPEEESVAVSALGRMTRSYL